MCAAERLSKKAVEVVGAGFSGGGVAAAVVEAGPDAALDGFDDCFVLPLDAIYGGIAADAGALPAASKRIPEEGDARQIDA